MRKSLVFAGILLGSIMLAGTPAKADLGCACWKLGQALTCVPNIRECTFRQGGVCLAPCDYQAPKKQVAKRKAKKKS